MNQIQNPKSGTHRPEVLHSPERSRSGSARSAVDNRLQNSQLSGAELLVESLIRFGVDVVFGLPGGANLPIYDALANHQQELRHVLVRHEQGAAFMAQGYARLRGRAGVCLASSGPGATNLITGIADAFRDSVPIVAITGQVPLALIGTDAFQEIDTRGMCLPITKHVFAVRSATELLAVLPQAFDMAEHGRPGPVVIDIPKDVQQERIAVEDWPERSGRAARGEGEVRPRHGGKAGCDETQLPESLRRVARMIRSASRPVILAGGGVIQANAGDLLREFARRSGIPVSTTFMGLGAFPADDPLFLGMPGMHAAPWTNFALDEADLLIAIGARFDDRATGQPEHFCSRARIVHIDIDASEIGKIISPELAIVADAAIVLGEFLNGGYLDDGRADSNHADSGHADSRHGDPVTMHGYPDWIARISALREKHPLWVPGGERDITRPLHLIGNLGAMLPPDVIITTDVGQHQMWVAQVFPFRRPRSLLSSGGLGSMGFGLPAAIGAAVAQTGAGQGRRARKVVCLSGDGSILMNLQELATLAELDLDVTVIVLDNRHLGLVRQQQELFYRSNFLGSRFASQTDFAALARAFGVRGYDLGEEPGSSAAAQGAFERLAEILEKPGPCLVRVPTKAEDLVLPMVPPGAANRDMIRGGRNQ